MRRTWAPGSLSTLLMGGMIARLFQRQGGLDSGCRHRLPGEQYEAPRSWTEKAYPKLIYYNKVGKGGHFAAWEQLLLFAEEVRAGFRSVR